MKKKTKLKSTSAKHKPGYLKPHGRPKVILGGGAHLVIAPDTLFDEDLYGDEPEGNVSKTDLNIPSRSIW